MSASLRAAAIASTESSPARDRRASMFAGWVGAAITLIAIGSCGDKGPTQPPVTVERTLTVVVAGAGAGTVTSQPAGIDCSATGGTCSMKTANGTQVTLTAAAGDRSDFGGWSDACSGAGTCTITLNADRNVGASFGNPHLVTAEIGPAGGTVTSADGRLTLTVPAGALSSVTTLTVEALDVSGLGPEFTGSEVGAAYRLGPSGQTFASPVELSVRSDHRIDLTDSTLSWEAELLSSSRDGVVELLSELTTDVGTDGSITVRGKTVHFSVLVRQRAGGKVRFVAEPIPPRLGVGVLAVATTTVLLEGVGAWRGWVKDLAEMPVAPTQIPAGSQVELVRRYADEREWVKPLLYTCLSAGVGRWRAEVGIELRALAGGDSALHNKTFQATLFRDVNCVEAASLTVRVVGPGYVLFWTNLQQVACFDECVEGFASGARVSLEAVPQDEDDVEFLGWEGDFEADPADPLAARVVMNGPKTIIARFGRKPSPVRHALTLRSDPVPEGAGAVVINPGGTLHGVGKTETEAKFPPGAQVTLTHEPAENGDRTTVQFSGAGALKDGNWVVVLDEPETTVDLSFFHEVVVTVVNQGSANGVVKDVGGAGGLRINCTAAGGPGCRTAIKHGDVLELAADPAHFKSWGGSASGTSATTAILVNRPLAVVANFAASPPPPGGPTLRDRVRPEVTADYPFPQSNLLLDKLRAKITGTAAHVMAPDETQRAVMLVAPLNGNAPTTHVTPINIRPAEPDGGVSGISFNQVTGRSYIATLGGLIESRDLYAQSFAIPLPDFNPNTDRLNAVGSNGNSTVVVGTSGGQAAIWRQAQTDQGFVRIGADWSTGAASSFHLVDVQDDRAAVVGRDLNSNWFLGVLNGNTPGHAAPTAFIEPVSVKVGDVDVWGSLWSGNTSNFMKLAANGTATFSPTLNNTPRLQLCLNGDGTQPIAGAAVGTFGSQATTELVVILQNLQTKRQTIPFSVAGGCAFTESSTGQPQIVFLQVNGGELQITTVPVGSDGTPGTPTSVPLIVPNAIGPAGSDILAYSRNSPAFAAGAFGVLMHDAGNGLQGAVLARRSNGEAVTVRAVLATGPAEAWAAGDAGIIMRFTGTGWTRTSNPAENAGAALYGLAGSGANDVYAVGANGTVLRWNGTAWSSVTAGLSGGAQAFAVWSGGPNSVYVGGFEAGSALLTRFNGSTWNRITLPLPPGDAVVGIWGSGEADVWAISNAGMLLRWNGSTWSVDPQVLRQFPGGARVPRAIGGSGPADVFVVLDGTPGVQSSLLVRYDGSGWHIVHEETEIQLLGIHVGTDGHVFVTGSHGTVLHFAR